MKARHEHGVTLRSAKNAVGPGWHGLIEAAYKRLKKEDVIVLQVKEKFGGLRIYVGGASSETHDFIESLEAQSYHICEFCGDPGKTRNLGWTFTLCEKCANKELKRRQNK